MIPVIRVKDGVQFAATVGDYLGRIAPSGFRILAALDAACQDIGHDVTITSGSDGCHSGENDPHHRGEAYDVRTHDLSETQKQNLLNSLKNRLGPRFYVFIEDPGTDNEHIHAQVAKGTTFPPVVESAIDEAEA